MGAEISQVDDTPSVIIITSEIVEKDKQKVANLPDYTKRLEEIKKRHKQLTKERLDVLLKIKDTYNGDPTILQALIPIACEIEALEMERNIITKIQKPLEERAKIISKLHKIAVKSAATKETKKKLKKLINGECICGQCHTHEQKKETPSTPPSSV